MNWSSGPRLLDVCIEITVQASLCFSSPKRCAEQHTGESLGKPRTINLPSRAARWKTIPGAAESNPESGRLDTGLFNLLN